MHTTPTQTDTIPAATDSTSVALENESPMQAIVQDRFGTADVLQFEAIERPTIADDEVLIEVHAAGVDRGTEHLMTGLPYLIRLAGYGITKPKNRILGLDVAGVVVEVGAAVTRFAKGDEVFGISNGSFAPYAAAAEEKLALKPENLSFELAAVSAVSGITALQALTIGQRFELKDVPEAMRQLGAGHASGKTAIIVRPADTPFR